MTNYYNKYLKYKQKYLLKHNGGSSEEDAKNIYTNLNKNIEDIPNHIPEYNNINTFKNLISIEGNIGAGKSTVLNTLYKYFKNDMTSKKIQVLHEPLEMWSPYFEDFLNKLTNESVLYKQLKDLKIEYTNKLNSMLKGKKICKKDGYYCINKKTQSGKRGCRSSNTGKESKICECLPTGNSWSCRLKKNKTDKNTNINIPLHILEKNLDITQNNYDIAFLQKQNTTFNFQMHVLYTFLKIFNDQLYKTTQNLIIERTPYSGLKLFIEVFCNDSIDDKPNTLTEFQCKLLYNYYNELFTTKFIPNIFIYIRTTPSISWQRIKTRNRPGEIDAYSEEYIKFLHDKHESAFRENTNVPEFNTYNYAIENKQIFEKNTTIYIINGDKTKNDVEKSLEKILEIINL